MRFARRIGAERSPFSMARKQGGDASPRLVSEHRARRFPNNSHPIARARRRDYAGRLQDVTPTNSHEEP